jgi:hypothetical protein
MPVVSRELQNDQAAPHARRPMVDAGGCALMLGRLGMWLAVASFGGIFWAINGGFSVIGLGVVAASFNDAGRLFWASVSSVQFAVPVRVEGLPTTQPLIPWIGVAAASCLQISVMWLKLSKRHIPLTLFLTVILLSAYDYVTTFYGLGTVTWIATIGWPAQLAIAVPMTFGIEAAIGYALRR